MADLAALMDLVRGAAEVLGPCLVWILGHSYVYWGALRADVRHDGRQLGVSVTEARVKWLGIRGMTWGRVRPEVAYYSRMDRDPDVLILHVGGNDLGIRSARELKRDIKLDLLHLWRAFPGIVIVWSDIIARTQWCFGRSVDRINRARSKLNRAIGRFVARNGGLVVRHRELEESTEQYLRGDGVHLTDVGLDLWMLGLRDGLEQALGVWGARAK
ncbi:uncharacterized protein ACNLHF_019241 [Anomaloglossus baeobatrachus]